ncbi:MAG: YeeE/YedE thiosulfate transporter family protein [Sphingomonas adhaesiva]|uniref:YeeE/YedE family protein n=1 Tax=Sphingomonas adhaesiva TaxID=28212 RepID=UPI002FF54C14
MPGFPHAMPLHGLAGGLMIGLAAALMLLVNGRVAGCSGLFARATGLTGEGVPRGIALAFAIGLPIGAAIILLTLGVRAHFPSSLVLLAVAGVVVGFGTRLGSGCTSGHGVVGMARLSPRSMAATATFMGFGIATATIMRLSGVAL